HESEGGAEHVADAEHADGAVGQGKTEAAPAGASPPATEMLEIGQTQLASTNAHGVSSFLSRKTTKFPLHQITEGSTASRHTAFQDDANKTSSTTTTKTEANIPPETEGTKQVEDVLRGAYVQVVTPPDYAAANSSTVMVKVLRPVRMKSFPDFDLERLVTKTRKSYFDLHSHKQQRCQDGFRPHSPKFAGFIRPRPQQDERAAVEVDPEKTEKDEQPVEGEASAEDAENANAEKENQEGNGAANTETNPTDPEPEQKIQDDDKVAASNGTEDQVDASKTTTSQLAISQTSTRGHQEAADGPLASSKATAFDGGEKADAIQNDTTTTAEADEDPQVPSADQNQSGDADQNGAAGQDGDGDNPDAITTKEGGERSAADQEEMKPWPTLHLTCPVHHPRPIDALCEGPDCTEADEATCCGEPTNEQRCLESASTECGSCVYVAHLDEPTQHPIKGGLCVWDREPAHDDITVDRTTVGEGDATSGDVPKGETIGTADGNTAEDAAINKGIGKDGRKLVCRVSQNAKDHCNALREAKEAAAAAAAAAENAEAEKDGAQNENEGADNAEYGGQNNESTTSELAISQRRLQESTNRVDEQTLHATAFVKKSRSSSSSAGNSSSVQSTSSTNKPAPEAGDDAGEPTKSASATTGSAASAQEKEDNTSETEKEPTEEQKVESSSSKSKDTETGEVASDKKDSKSEPQQEEKAKSATNKDPAHDNDSWRTMQSLLFKRKRNRLKKDGDEILEPGERAYTITEEHRDREPTKWKNGEVWLQGLEIEFKNSAPLAKTKNASTFAETPAEVTTTTDVTKEENQAPGIPEQHFGPLANRKARLGRYFPDTDEYELFFEEALKISVSHLHRSHLQPGDRLEYCGEDGAVSAGTLGRFHPGGHSRDVLPLGAATAASFDVHLPTGLKKVPVAKFVEHGPCAEGA
ncbi:unnamed protein product, partial [Amoebophrya sp. A120]